MSEDGTSDSEDGESPPDPPSSIPTYVTEAIQRQDEVALRKVIAYAQQLSDRTPKSPSMTRDFDPADIQVGDIVRHSSSKSTVKSNTGQVARVLGDEAVEIWDTDGEIRAVSKASVTAISVNSIDKRPFSDVVGDDE